MPELKLVPRTSPADVEPRRAYSVSVVVARAAAVLKERAPHPIWVRGEVSNWKRDRRSGHCYFRLKDDQAEIDCVLWCDDADALPALPGEGMEVDALGTVGIFARRGQFRLEVKRIETTGGDGLWHVAKERLLAQLREEGLLDEGRKRPLPAFPERIGLVTSAGSAALQDMWRTMRRRAWWIRVQVSGCAVEGAAAAPEIVRALRRFGTGPGQVAVDVVIVARGGGSRESLWAFNTEPVARAIAACPFPVISAVGHETDYTVADQVADRRAATPTAGAEQATPDGRELLERLDAYPGALRRRAERALADAAAGRDARLEAVERRIRQRHRVLADRGAALERLVQTRAPRERQRRLQERLDGMEQEIHRALGERREALVARAERLGTAVDRALELRVGRLEHELARRAAEAEAKSPLRTLARGYAVVRAGADGRVVRAPDDAPAGTPLSIHLRDGVLRATSAGPDPATPEMPDA